MYFDFDDRFERYEPVGGSVRRWDGLLLSVGFHVVLIAVALLLPALPIFQTRFVAEVQPVPRPDPEEDRPRFVFVQPKLDRPAATPPPRAEASDIDRRASSLEMPRVRDNPLPSARGNSSERVEASPEERPRGRGTAPEPAPEVPPEVTVPKPPDALARTEMTLPNQRPQPPQGGSLGEALRNLQRYVDKESFNNDRSQVQNLGPLQFDTKGIEFGPWIRRFVAQVRRNWFVPMAAMSLRGHVVLTFNVHRNGALTDVQVVQPSSVESFNTAAMNALLASNPTEPLPPEYPADKAFFTVTFYYNETPVGQ